MSYTRLYVILLCAAAAMSGTAQQNHNFSTAKQLDIFNALYRALDLNYVDTLDAQKHVGNAIDYMLSGIDPYTVYYKAEDTEDLKSLSTGKYAGIGSPIVYRPDYDCAVFSSPYLDMPAYKHGVRSGDRIRKIDGEVVSGTRPADRQKYLSSITDKLRGEPGTTVVVEVERPVSTGPDSVLTQTIAIVRQQIRRPNIECIKMLDETVGYISLSGYTEGAADELKTAMQSLKSQGMKSMVLDLRGNGGGLLNEAVSMVGLFVKKGTEVVSMKGRNPRANEVFTTDCDPLDRSMPLVVLTDYGTASAAEITSGALQDMDRAVIVGSRTYGKGLVQQSIKLPYGSALKFTAAKYYIPSGRCVQALDYSRRGDDGQPLHMADSLCTTYYTRGHRPVRDGGGISPDVVVRADTLPSIIGYLRLSTQLFDWATLYQNTHRGIPAVKDFRLTDEEMQEFHDFLVARGFKYDNRSKQKLAELRQWARAEGYAEESAALFDQLESVLAHDLSHDFERWSKELREVAEAEVIGLHYGESGVMDYALKDDSVVREALAILHDTKRYDKILGK